MAGTTDELDLSDGEQERYDKIRAHDLPDAAIRRFLTGQDFSVPEDDDNFKRKVATQLTDETVDELIREYKYAGPQTINYYVLTGINEYDLDQIIATVDGSFPERENVEGITNEPYLADFEIDGSQLYLTFGFFISTGGVEPTTGRRKPELTTGRCIAVIYDGLDLVELRTSEPSIAGRIVDGIAESLGGFRDSSMYQPEFDVEFQDSFEDLVEKYTNLKVRVEDREGTTVDTISFTSRKTGSGERKDARKDERVTRELEERGGEITIGYVQLNEGFRFQINRKQAKISIKKHEQEANITRITRIIHDVLRETGGYTQSTFRGLEDVPE